MVSTDPIVGADQSTSAASSGSPSVRFALARTRVAVAVGLGLLTLGLGLALTAWQVAVLIAWSVTGLVIVVWAIAALRRLNGTATQVLATREDDSRTMADVLLLSAAMGSLAAIGLGLLKAADAKGSAQPIITALAVLTVVVSWAVVHTVFTLRYARLYYAVGGGIDFNEDAEPDYRDFAYVALTIGMTFQVSDTDLTTKSIRHAATRHALVSYLFGAVIIAMVINVVAGLLNR
jgi:uncharacterized membrane protein